MIKTGKRWLLAPLLVVACLAGGGVAARLADGLRLDVPVPATPDAAYDLILIYSAIIRGRPFGRHQRIRLNAAGFRGPPITLDPPNGCVRVIVLGASESVVGGEA